MKTKTIELYEFDELPEDTKAKVLEKYRDINVDFSQWDDFEIEYWEEELEKMGFDDPEIAYSGFCCQGDGASFTCKRVDVEKFITSQRAKSRFKALLKAIRSGKIEIEASVNRISHSYSHEYTVGVSTELYYNEPPKNPKNYEKLEREEGELRGFIQDVVRTFSRKIYRGLEESYEALTSDEQVSETLRINEYTFRANGEMENS